MLYYNCVLQRLIANFGVRRDCHRSYVLYIARIVLSLLSLGLSVVWFEFVSWPFAYLIGIYIALGSPAYILFNRSNFLFKVDLDTWIFFFLFNSYIPPTFIIYTGFVIIENEWEFSKIEINSPRLIWKNIHNREIWWVRVH